MTDKHHQHPAPTRRAPATRRNGRRSSLTSERRSLRSCALGPDSRDLVAKSKHAKLSKSARCLCWSPPRQLGQRPSRLTRLRRLVARPCRSRVCLPAPFFRRTLLLTSKRSCKHWQKGTTSACTTRTSSARTSQAKRFLPMPRANRKRKIRPHLRRLAASARLRLVRSPLRLSLKTPSSGS